MTTQFSALTEATALVTGDELAVARGAATMRMALAVIRAGLTGDQDGPAIVALLEALTGNGRLDANAALRNLQAAVDAAVGDTDWRTPGVGTSDGVLSALALAADGTVSATITGGTDFTADFGPSIIALAAGGGTTLTTTIKQPVAVGVPSDVNIVAADRFYDSTIDMPATADIADNDEFAFSIQYRATGNPILHTFWTSGRDWKRLVALTTAEQGQTSFSAASAAKTMTGFFRRTSSSGGQAQQNAYFAKGADGVSLYVGDNNDPFDATVAVTMIADTPITGLQGPTGAVGSPNLHGSGTPADTLGDDGQWYLNTDDGAWFQKASGTWGTAVYTDMAGTTDGVINTIAAALANSVLTLTAGRSVGNDVVSPGLTLPFLLLAGGALTGALTGTQATFSGALAAASAAITNAITAATLTLTGALTGTTGAFSGVVSGVTPTADAHLATKAYVDAQMGMMTPTPTDDIYFGTSADETPQGSELTIAATNGTAVIPAYVGDMHVLLARLDTEADFTRVLRSDDVAQINQIGAFTKFATTVVPTGETLAFGVWVSNQALTQAADVAWTAS